MIGRGEPSDYTLEVNGTPPQIVGRACEGLVCQAYTCNGEPVASAHITYLKFGGAWSRIYFEFRVVFWRQFEGEQKPWEAYPHTDIGTLAGVLGQPLAAYAMLPTVQGSKVLFRFGNGRCVEIEDKDNVASYAVI